MDHFNYRDGVLYAEDVPLTQLAAELGMGGWSQSTSLGIAAAMTLHVAACMPHLTQAHDLSGPMVWEDTLVNEAFPFAEGYYEVPDRPGLGYTLNHDAAGRYLIEKRMYE